MGSEGRRETIGDNRPIKRHADYFEHFYQAQKLRPQTVKRDALSVSDSTSVLRGHRGVQLTAFISDLEWLNRGWVRVKRLAIKLVIKSSEKVRFEILKLMGTSIPTTRFFFTLGFGLSICVFLLARYACYEEK